jgi:serine/threonine protein phosphatase PrpC
LSFATALFSPQYTRLCLFACLFACLQYAYWTQRGYYPDDPHKENQDELSISLKFASEPRDAMFGIYDGHGKHGHDSSRYCKKKLPDLLQKHIRKARVKKYQAHLQQNNMGKTKLYDPENWPFLDAEEYKDCCRKSYLECNQNMHDDDEVRDCAPRFVTTHAPSFLTTRCYK